MKINFYPLLDDFLVKMYLADATKNVAKAPQLIGMNNDACDKVQ